MAETARANAIVEPSRIEGRTLAVLYGSETGNGEDIAEELADMARRLHFETEVDAMDSFKLVGHRPPLPTAV